MFKKILFAALVFSSCWAKAAYTCNDRDYLRQALQQLDSQCGSNGGSNPIGGINCIAGGQVGKDLAETIDKCYAKTSLNRQQCADQLRCFGNVRACAAGGQAAPTLSETIDKCYAKTSLNREQCGAKVQCFQSYTQCMAGGQVGNDPGEALDKCYAKTSNNREQCGDQLRCY